MRHIFYMASLFATGHKSLDFELALALPAIWHYRWGSYFALLPSPSNAFGDVTSNGYKKEIVTKWHLSKVKSPSFFSHHFEADNIFGRLWFTFFRARYCQNKSVSSGDRAGRHGVTCRLYFRFPSLLNNLDLSGWSAYSRKMWRSQNPFQ